MLNSETQGTAEIEENLNICKYDKDCHEKVNRPHHNTLCVFHAPTENKGVSEREYKELIFSKIANGNLNFRGYIFPWEIYNDYWPSSMREPNFTLCVFHEHADFSEKELINPSFKLCKFLKSTTFNNTTFNGDTTEFNHTHFKESVFFERSIFNCKDLLFIKASVTGDHLTFKESEFKCNILFRDCSFQTEVSIDFSGLSFPKKINIYKSIFSSKYIDFSNTTFNSDVRMVRVNFELSKPKFLEVEFTKSFEMDNVSFHAGVKFTKCRFLGQSTHFLGVSCGQESIINQCTILGKLRIEKIRLKATVEFSELNFDSQSYFELTDPIILKDGKFPINITFKKSIFNPLHSTFLGISGDAIPILFINFENCSLSNTKFLGSNLRAFRFYDTNIGDILFHSCYWPEADDKLFWIFSHKRKGVLGEEAFASKDLNKNRDQLLKLADQYRQMKVALDSQHDYINAGQFYYNKNEMERKAAIASMSAIELKNFFFKIFEQHTQFNHQPIRKFIRKGIDYFSAYLKWFLYTLYKYGAGYGERPNWSLTWLIIFFLGLIFINLNIGFSEYLSSSQTCNIDYMWGFGLPSWMDFSHSITYTLGQINIFKQFFGQQHYPYYAPADDWGTVFHIFASCLLYFQIGFLIIGIQRRFKRF